MHEGHAARLNAVKEAHTAHGNAAGTAVTRELVRTEERSGSPLPVMPAPVALIPALS